jgi:hypothetical protein
MQRQRFMFAAVLAVGLSLLGVPSAAPAAVAVSVSVFHDHLAPYGRWVVAGSYGSVWVPRVAAGWAPYVDGEWAYTDYGWTWVSYDPWGGDPCHYGSWAWVDSYGWVWTPGTVWAPAWVTWAYTDDYVGWAPIPPTFALSMTGYVGSPVVLATTRYCFVPTRQFVGVRVNSVRIPVERNAAIFSSAVKTTSFRVSGGVVRAAGPPTANIERVTAHKISPVSIDRVKTRPTTLAEAGIRSGSRVAVAAPAAEREHIAAAKPEAQTKQAVAKEPVAKSEKARAEAPKSAAAKPAPAHPARHTDENTTTAEHHEAQPPVKPKAKAAPEKHEEVAKKSAPKPAPKEPAKTEVAKKSPPKPAPKKEPQAEPPAENRATEETRVASHETRHAPAPAHPAKPVPKPKAQPEHPQPPKEEKPGE